MHLVFIHETLAKQNNEISFGLSCSSQLFIAMDDELTSKKPRQSKSSSPFPTCENVIFPILRNYQLLRLDHWGRPSIKDIFPRKLHHSQKGGHKVYVLQNRFLAASKKSVLKLQAKYVR